MRSGVCAFDMSLMTSWYLLLAVTRPACSRLRRFLRIFLFFCSRGSWLSSSTAGLLFSPSGVWASCTARRSMIFTCSDSFRNNDTNALQITVKVLICFGTDAYLSKNLSKERDNITCGAEAGVSRISDKVSPGWIRITSTISFLVLTHKQTLIFIFLFYWDFTKLKYIWGSVICYIMTSRISDLFLLQDWTHECHHMYLCAILQLGANFLLLYPEHVTQCPPKFKWRMQRQTLRKPAFTYGGQPKNRTSQVSPVFSKKLI